MRATVTIAIAMTSLVLASGGAAAQGLNADGLYPLPGVSPKETSPISRLPKEAIAWMGEESARQAKAPGDMIELAFEIEIAIGPAIMQLAERERIDTRDLVLTVMYDIMGSASEALKKELRAAEAIGRRGDGGPQAGAVHAELVARKQLADKRLSEVIRNQTVVSRSFVGR